MVVAWISDVLIKDLIDSMMYVYSSREMWIKLEDKFVQANSAELCQVQKEMCYVN